MKTVEIESRVTLEDIIDTLSDPHKFSVPELVKFVKKLDSAVGDRNFGIILADYFKENYG